MCKIALRVDLRELKLQNFSVNTPRSSIEKECVLHAELVSDTDEAKFTSINSSVPSTLPYIVVTGKYYNLQFTASILWISL